MKEITREKGVQGTLFLNAGDHFQGTLWYTLFKSKVVADFVKLFEYDAMSLGNHEFDDGPSGLASFLDLKGQLPILACNLNVSSEPRLKGRILKSVKIWKNARQIGIIGYVTPETRFLSRPGPTVTFLDEIAAIREQVGILKAQGITILIAVGHSGYGRDLEIAKAIPELDIVVGGHTNSFLWTPQTGSDQSGPPSIEKSVGFYPTVIEHANDGRRTLVVQAGAYGKYLGRLDVSFDEDGQVVVFEGKFKGLKGLNISKSW